MHPHETAAPLMAHALTPRPSLRDEANMRLTDAIKLYRNGDGVSERYAIQAYVDGRPAFWTSAQYHDQLACNLCDLANLTFLPDALADTYPAHRAYKRRDALDTLVPLNREAAQELSEAYAALGSWREPEELEQRRLRDGRA